jgi:4-hydroxy-tetrahydrodipicolinate synthase
VLHERYLPLMRVNFVSPNPVPVKAALAAMGLIEDVLRQPLLPLAEPGRSRLLGILRALDLAGEPAQAVAA